MSRMFSPLAPSRKIGAVAIRAVDSFASSQSDCDHSATLLALSRASAQMIRVATDLGEFSKVKIPTAICLSNARNRATFMSHAVFPVDGRAPTMISSPPRNPWRCRSRSSQPLGSPDNPSRAYSNCSMARFASSRPPNISLRPVVVSRTE